MLDIKVKKTTIELSNSDGHQLKQDKYNNTFKNVSAVKLNHLPKSIREECYRRATRIFFWAGKVSWAI